MVRDSGNTGFCKKQSRRIIGKMNQWGCCYCLKEIIGGDKYHPLRTIISIVIDYWECLGRAAA